MPAGDRKMKTHRAMLGCIAFSVFLCNVAVTQGADMPASKTSATALAPVRPEIYASFKLTADLATLTANERKMLGLFIDAADIMNDLFWRQTYGDKRALLDRVTDPRTRQFVEFNYGP